MNEVAMFLIIFVLDLCSRSMILDYWSRPQMDKDGRDEEGRVGFHPATIK